MVGRIIETPYRTVTTSDTLAAQANALNLELKAFIMLLRKDLDLPRFRNGFHVVKQDGNLVVSRDGQERVLGELNQLLKLNDEMIARNILAAMVELTK